LSISSQLGTDMEAVSTTTVEFEHSIGNSVVTNGACFHPNGQNYIYCAGWNVGVGDLTNPHSQHFLRGHDGYITALALSPSGRYVASGQLGDHSDIIVWDFESRRKIFSFEEHDHKIQALAFSHDERILVSIGNSDDGNLIAWDLSNGCIIASAARIPLGTTCLALGGFVRDIKRRDTSHYLICTGGRDGLVLWDLDPYSGDLVSERLVGDARATISREVTGISFSYDRELIFASTQSGDFMIASCKAKRIKKAVQATKLGLSSIVAFRGGLAVGGGDGSLIIFDDEEPFQARSQSSLDGSSVISLSLSADHLEVVAATAAGSVYRINLSNMQQITIAESHTGAVVALAFPSHSSERFASASSDGSIRYVNIVCCCRSL
jgi:WD40 repeat protein